jgi:hypothetical protein
LLIAQFAFRLPIQQSSSSSGSLVDRHARFIRKNSAIFLFGLRFDSDLNHQPKNRE